MFAMTDEERLAGGIAAFAKTHGTALGELGPVDPDSFAAYSLRNLYNDVWGRDELSMRDRRMLLLGVLAAQSLDWPLGVHLRCAIEQGEMSRPDVEEIKRVLAGYIGFPKVVLFDQAWQRVLAELDGKENETPSR
jgi:4-carboxymuconolactone decarboxylase